jgi:enoyl-CoA hydratase
MNGIVMGGGIGLSAHASHRVVTDTTSIAMPETNIGFIPDVGGTYLLSRKQGELGTHLALTAGRIGAADAILLGLADVHVRTGQLTDLFNALLNCRNAEDIDAVFAAVASPPEPGRLAEAEDWINQAYAADTVEQICKNLAHREEPGAKAALAELTRNSPTSLKVTLKALRQARRTGRLGPCLEMELIIARHCLRGHDMREGVRAAVIDKDRNPQWSPAALAGVTAEMVDRHFDAEPANNPTSAIHSAGQ